MSHTAETMRHSKTVESAMEMQCVALRLLESDREESLDYEKLATLAVCLKSVAERCIKRDREENRDHALMQSLAGEICETLERKEEPVLVAAKTG